MPEVGTTSPGSSGKSTSQVVAFGRVETSGSTAAPYLSERMSPNLVAIVLLSLGTVGFAIAIISLLCLTKRCCRSSKVHNQNQMELVTGGDDSEEDHATERDIPGLADGEKQEYC